MNNKIKDSILVAASALALTSCSQEDVTGLNPEGGNQIAFRTSLPQLTTKAQIVTEKNLPYFYVTGFDMDDLTQVTSGLMKPLFNNEKVVVVSGKEKFTSPKCVWPDKSSDVVTFFGSYPGPDDVPGAELVNNTSATEIDYKLKGFRVESEISKQLDFVTAYTSGTMDTNLFNGVTLPFSHQLSRIEIFAYGKHKSCDIEIAGVRIGGVGVEGTFVFKPLDGGGEWQGDPVRGIVEYIFGDGDLLVVNGKNHPVQSKDSVSIMGRKHVDGNENCAMVIPSTYAEWDYKKDRLNVDKKMFISVLLRVTDATPTAGKDPEEPLRFPYKDLSQGKEAQDLEFVYLAVEKSTGAVKTRVYKNETGYFTDSEFKTEYPVPSDVEVKEFGWAALPVSATWEPGKIYTYTLDYTVGVGLLDPEYTTRYPGAGDPVISDKVGITCSVKEWVDGGGKEFPVPGS